VRKRQSLESLSRAEGAQLDKVAPGAAAEMLSRLLLDQRNTFYTVLTSAADIPKRGCCEIDVTERPKYEGKIRPPGVTGGNKSGWSVEFYTLSGWMHETQELTRHVIEVSAQYEITRREEILSMHVFSKLWGIVY
jgi:hypothetical protein